MAAIVISVDGPPEVAGLRDWLALAVGEGLPSFSYDALPASEVFSVEYA
jgi:hypothetical protein